MTDNLFATKTPYIGVKDEKIYPYLPLTAFSFVFIPKMTFPKHRKF